MARTQLGRARIRPLDFAAMLAADPYPAFLRDIESRSFWRALAPWLHVEARESAAHEIPPNRTPRSPWPASGYLALNAVLDPATALALARAVEAVHARSLHPTFLYVYDEAWQVLDALRPRLVPFLGAVVDVLPDVWAWYIDPRTDASGWPIHRGVYEDVRDPAGTPGLVNLWIALTDVTERNACMHVVPLDRDPHFPTNLKNLGALENRGLALPILAGGALVWNANVAHWGGTCDPTFGKPRVSMSFTLRGRRVLETGTPGLRLPLSFRDRLDLIAEQFATYGDLDLAPERNEMRWAAMVSEMRGLAARVFAASKP